jgi:hypothetical protein
MYHIEYNNNDIVFIVKPRSQQEPSF